MIVKTVGRGQDNSIVVNDDKVSRTHLQLVQDDNRNISVVDLGSTNGTYVNGTRIVGETRLKAGDTVRIGDITLPWQSYFRDVQPPAPPMPPIPTPSPLHPKHKMTWLYIVGGALLILLIAGGAIILVNSHKKNKNERIALEQKEGLRIKLENEKKLKEAELDAARADAEYEKALKAVNMAKSAKEREELNRIVKEKAEAVQLANDNVKRLNAEKDGLNKKLTEVNNTLSEREKELDKANEATRKALNEKDSVLKIERQKTKDYEEQVKQVNLTNEFYKILNKAEEDDKLKVVCDALKITSAKNDSERKKRIIGKFNGAKDNTTRENTINIMKEAMLKAPKTNHNSKTPPDSTGTQPPKQKDAI